MWTFYYKKLDPDNSKGCLSKCIDWCKEKLSNCCPFKSIDCCKKPDFNFSKCCSCDWINKCVLACSVFRRIDGLKPNLIPEINSIFP